MTSTVSKPAVGPRILVKYPTRERWGMAIQRVHGCVRRSHFPASLHLIITADNDDIISPGERACIERMCRGSNVTLSIDIGPRAGKVSAINRGIPSSQWDILVVLSDDMRLTCGWDLRIREDAQDAAAIHGATWALNYNVDQRRLGERWRDLIIMPVMSRSLYEQMGYVYHPDYLSEYCDDEQTAVFTKMGVLHHVNYPVACHDWVANRDKLAEHNMRVGQQQDRVTLERRREAGFPKHSLFLGLECGTESQPSH